MKTILFAAAASLALSAAPALAGQMDQGGHRSVAGYEHCVQAEAGGGNGGAGQRYADASGAEGGTHLRYADASGAEGGTHLRYADASGAEGGTHLRYADAGGGGEGGSPRAAAA